MKNFDKLRAANIQRQNQWPGGENITLGFRGVELAGEVGELANLTKKLIRIELDIKGTEEAMAALRSGIREELGDVAICVDLIGMHTANPVWDPAAAVRPDPEVDPATYADDITRAVGDLVGASGELTLSCTVGYERAIPIEVVNVWATLLRLSYVLRLNLWACVEAKFNATSKKHGFSTRLEGIDVE